MRWIERSADGTIAYGEHVAAYARGHGSRNVVVAPQAVDGAFWGAAVEPGAAAAARAAAGDPAFLALYAGRAAPGKGVDVLLDAWAATGLTPPGRGARARRGEPPQDVPAATGVVPLGQLAPEQLRNLYAAADVVVVPSVPTRAFREPWALVVNEAMSQRTPVIATDAVGAAAGGLVRDGETGFVVPAGDPAALAAAITALHGDAALRDRLGAAGAAAVREYTPAAWADAVCAALATALSGDRGPLALRPMLRRLLVPVLLLACLITPAVAQAGYQELLKDACRDEHVNGTYSQKDYTDALANIPADADQYTNCRDVLRAAQLAAASAQAAGHTRLARR